MSTLRITVEAEAGQEWDDFVRRQPGWTHFHLSAWQQVIRRVWRHDTIYLAARHPDGSVSAILPLVRIRSPLFGHFLCSLPFVNYGGPLGDEAGVRALAAHATALAASTGVDLTEFRSYQPLPLELPVSHRKVTGVLDLPAQAPASLLTRLDAKVRNQVRRPAKEGVRFEFGRAQVAPFFAVFSEHMRDLGTPTQPLQLFETLADTFPDDCWFGCAWLGDVPIAGGCGFRWGTEFEMTWASALRAHAKLSPNMGLYWAFMERAIADGLTLFNFGRCSVDSGTHRFKRQWGSRDVPLWWYQAARGLAKTPSPDDSRFALGPKIWRHLPVAVANRLGPPIVRLIP